MGPTTSKDNSFVGPVTLVTTTETIVLTSLPVSTTDPNQQLSVFGGVNLTGGTGTTGVIVRFRRGTTVTSPLIGGQDTTPLVGTATTSRNNTATDVPGEVDGQQYVMTVQLVGATGNGSVLDGGMSIRYPTS